MSATVKGAVLACFLFALCVPAFAATVDEVAERQRRIMLKELDDKINPPAKPEAAGAVALPSGLPRLPDGASAKELLPVAIYGPAESLVADVRFGNAIFTVRPGDTVDGWKVTGITPSRVIRTKGKETKEDLLTLPGAPRARDDANGVGMPPAPGTF